MEYSALTIGLTDELFSNIQTLLTSNLRRYSIADCTRCQPAADSTGIPPAGCGFGVSAEHPAS